ncbi:MAG: hypothetical protein Kow0065_11270 [Methylomicrobium sp.]
MISLRYLSGCLLVYCLCSATRAETDTIVDHVDPIKTDPQLNLSQLIDTTIQQYPDAGWLDALEQEAKAIALRSRSWVAGPANADLSFMEATSGTLHILDAAVSVPLWNFGQRDAERDLANRAEANVQSQQQALKLRVAGLVRSALWDIALTEVRHDSAEADYRLTRQLLEKVERRYELGDLPRSDVLLAQSELLQKKSALIAAEAEVMHARKRYTNLTRIDTLPAEYREPLAPLKAIESQHPALAALNGRIDRKQAELEAIRLEGPGQTQVSIGINSDRGNNDPRSNYTESFGIGISMPFGGSAHLAPRIAAVNVELNQLLAEREQMFRDLQLAYHEAEHALQVNRAETATAEQMKALAEEHLKMTELSFSVGEVNLIELLRIRARTQQAVLSAKERAVILQRDIALYNQAVGVLP